MFLLNRNLMLYNVYTSSVAALINISLRIRKLKWKQINISVNDFILSQGFENITFVFIIYTTNINLLWCDIKRRISRFFSWTWQCLSMRKSFFLILNRFRYRIRFFSPSINFPIRSDPRKRSRQLKIYPGFKFLRS